MLKAELFEIITNGENSKVEFKRDDLKPEQLAREIVAFANAYGGKIFLGVEDDGVISGLRHTNTEEWVLNVFRDKVHPHLIPEYEGIEVEKNKKVAVITVPMGTSKPYVVRHNESEQMYIRIASRTQKTSREEQMRLFQSGGMLHVEVLPVVGVKIENLDMSRIEYYMSEILKEPEIPSTTSGWIQLLTFKGLMAEDSLGRPVCSVAGLLLFGIKPRRILGEAGLRVMSYSGLDKDYESQLDKVLDAPLVCRWQKVSDTRREMADEGLIEEFDSIIEPFITQEAPNVDKSFRRDKTWFYPRDAVRELVINALAHRDWSRLIDIEVSNYGDRLEVISPGAFVNSMNVEKMVAGQRTHRNQLIAGILRDYGYIEGKGMGVRTKVIPSMRSLNKVDPIFEATDDYVKTILPRKKVSE